MSAARIEWLLCWAAYRVVMIIPNTWRAYWRLLPYAGLYGYTDGGFEEYRSDRTGFCTMALDNCETMALDLNAALAQSLAEEPKP